MRPDRAVAFGLLQVLARGLTGLGTALLVSTCLLPAEQGYYFTFSSLLALQTMAELGMPLVLLQFAAHEWGLGAHGRLAGLLRRGDRWFAAAGALSTLALLTAGTAFLAGPGADVAWPLPWSALALMGGARIACNGRLVLLEACGHVTTVQQYRLVEALVTAAAAWAGLASGVALWAPALASAASLACLGAFLRRHRGFFDELRRTPESPVPDMGPMQWRVALGAVAGHLAFSVLTPAVFHAQGAAAAGRMGLTWTVACGLRDLGGAWLAARVPDFAARVARREFDELDAGFRRTVAASTATLAVLAAGAWATVAALGVLAPALAARFLPLLPTAFLLVGHLLFHLTGCLAAWLRAHRREPLLGVSALMATLVVGGTVLTAGTWECAAAFALAQAATLAATLGVWSRCRRQWHGRIPAEAPRSSAP